MPDHWRQAVIAALNRLVHGDERGFEDTLWLELGDSWWPLRQALIRKGLIEVTPQSSYPKLTPRGKAFLHRTGKH